MVFPKKCIHCLIPSRHLDIIVQELPKNEDQPESCTQVFTYIQVFTAVPVH